MNKGVKILAVSLALFVISLGLIQVKQPAEPVMSDIQESYVDGCYDYALLVVNACGTADGEYKIRCKIEVQQECINLWDSKQDQPGEEQ